MPKNKGNQIDSKGSMGNRSSSEFDRQGQGSSQSNKGGQQAGSYGKNTGSQSNLDDDDLTTSGGREGRFSDKNQSDRGQWSPGSRSSSDS